MRVLLIAPNIDGTDVGEAFVAFKWAQALSPRVELTVLSFERPGRTPLAHQLPDARVVTWPEPRIARIHERFNAMAKPAWPIFARRVRRFLRTSGLTFDMAHQLMPQAARYPSPLRHGTTPFIIGPLGGTLDNPTAFQCEMGSAPLFTRLRALDNWRFRHDPALRASYSKAAAVLGVAPYMQELLADIPLQRFEPVLELGVDNVSHGQPIDQNDDKIRLLHVGRGVRSKGLRDTIRALAQLKDMAHVTLTSAGDGEDIAHCKSEAQKLGLSDRVTFLGKVPRDRVEQLYATHDIFCFPSFREPAGNVLYEAMRNGLPVITAARGGPDWIIDDTCGIRVPVSTPTQYATDVATAIRRLATDNTLRRSMGENARKKLMREGLWSEKANRLVDLYADILRAPLSKG